VADDSVSGAFDPVGVVPSAFEYAGAGAVPAFRVGLSLDFGDRVGDRVVQVFRG
jgi:hypothetical protein